jgi:hypothetical protein
VYKGSENERKTTHLKDFLETTHVMHSRRAISSLERRKQKSVCDIFKLSFIHFTECVNDSQRGLATSCMMCENFDDIEARFVICPNSKCYSQYCLKCVGIILSNTREEAYPECPSCQAAFAKTSLSVLLNWHIQTAGPRDMIYKEKNQDTHASNEENLTRQNVLSILDDICNGVTRRCTPEDMKPSFQIPFQKVLPLPKDNADDYSISLSLEDIHVEDVLVSRDSTVNMMTGTRFDNEIASKLSQRMFPSFRIKCIRLILL